MTSTNAIMKRALAYAPSRLHGRSCTVVASWSHSSPTGQWDPWAEGNNSAISHPSAWSGYQLWLGSKTHCMLALTARAGLATASTMLL